MVRYFDYSAEDAFRIAVVEAEYESGFDGWSDEIASAELPEGFAQWQEYTAFAKGDATVRVLSVDGD